MEHSQDESPESVRAVAYVRRSTKGQVATAKGRHERQEKSLDQQRGEIQRIARERGIQIVRWHEDDGISGTKGGRHRPGFERMLATIEAKRDITIIMVDEMDRFSRQTRNEVDRVRLRLYEAGVETIISASQGDFTVSSDNIEDILRWSIAVWASNEYSRKLSRRISLAERNNAREGKRTGGPPPYGYANDGQGGLKLGDKTEVRAVRLIFDLFIHQNKSMRWIAGELNRRGIRNKYSPRWTTTAVGRILKNRVYRGDFVFGKSPGGKFTTVGPDKEVHEVTNGTSRRNGDGVIVIEGRYPSIVDPVDWDRAQQIMRERSRSSRKPRENRLAMSGGILVCGHCGGRMNGLVGVPGQRTNRYRCTTPCHMKGGCREYSIRESEILPFALQLLASEMEKLTDVLAVRPPHAEDPCDRQDMEQQVENLEARIGAAVDILIDTADQRTQSSLRSRITAMQDELEVLQSDLRTSDEEDEDEHRREQLLEWWQSFRQTAVAIPVDESTKKVARRIAAEASKADCRIMPLSRNGKGGWVLRCDPAALNEALHEIGCKITLRWTTNEVQTRKGKLIMRHFLNKGRFQLGQRSGNLNLHQVLQDGCG